MILSLMADEVDNSRVLLTGMRNQSPTCDESENYAKRLPGR